MKHEKEVTSTLDNKDEEAIKKYSLPKPNLLKRLFSALVDFFFVAILFAGLEATTYYTLFDKLGYHAMIDEVHELYDNSHLYAYSEKNGYQSLTDTYNDTKTPDENYDPYITYYYTFDARAIKSNKLETYKSDKLAAKTLFTFDDNNEIIRIEGSDDKTAKEFYSNQYDSAISFFESNPKYYQNAQKPYYIIVYSCLINVLISGAIFYILIPLLTKDGATISSLIFKLGVADARDDTKVKKSQIVIRGVVIILMNYIIPILLYASFEYFTLIPILISFGMINFSKNNLGPHDLLSRTYMVNKKGLVIKDTPEKEVVITDDDDCKNPYL